MNLPPKEGVGNAGCPLHPRPRVHLVVVERTRVTTSTPESPGIPHALCFFKGASFMYNSGAPRGENAKLRLMKTNAPHFQPSSSAKADDPVFRDVSDGIERPRRTASSGQARR